MYELEPESSTKADKTIDRVFTLLDRVFGAIGAGLIGLIIGIVIAFKTGNGLSLPPSQLDQLAMIGGGAFGIIVGIIFPRPFVWILGIFSGITFGSN